jgi:hypothetical protein
MSKNPKIRAVRPQYQDQVRQQQVPDQTSLQSPVSSGEPSTRADSTAPTEPAPPTEAPTDATAAAPGAHHGSQAAEPAKPSPAGAKFDLSQAELHARGKKSAPVQPPTPKKGDSNVLYIEGAAAVVPFAALEAFWRALWSIIAAALGVDRTNVLYAPAAQLQDGQLMASAHYWMSSALVELLATPDGWAMVDLGLRMLSDPYLWQDGKLDARFRGQPWQKLLETVRSARDEIAGPKLPCQVDVEFSRIGQVITIGPELAPCRPPVETVNTEYLTGRSVGFKLDEVHLMHFSTKNGQPEQRSAGTARRSVRPFPIGLERHDRPSSSGHQPLQVGCRCHCLPQVCG